MMSFGELRMPLEKLKEQLWNQLQKLKKIEAAPARTCTQDSARKISEQLEQIINLYDRRVQSSFAAVCKSICQNFDKIFDDLRGLILNTKDFNDYSKDLDSSSSEMSLQTDCKISNPQKWNFMQDAYRSIQQDISNQYELLGKTSDQLTEFRASWLNMEAKCEGLEESWRDMGNIFQQQLNELKQGTQCVTQQESVQSAPDSDNNITLRKTQSSSNLATSSNQTGTQKTLSTSDSTGGLLSSLGNLFARKNSNQPKIIRADLGRPANAMRWDDQKKKYVFDGDDSSSEEDIPKAPPKMDELKKLREEKKEEQKTAEEDAGQIGALLKPRARNLGKPKGREQKPGIATRTIPKAMIAVPTLASDSLSQQEVLETKSIVHERSQIMAVINSQIQDILGSLNTEFDIGHSVDALQIEFDQVFEKSKNDVSNNLRNAISELLASLAEPRSIQLQGNKIQFSSSTQTDDSLQISSYVTHQHEEDYLDQHLQDLRLIIRETSSGISVEPPSLLEELKDFDFDSVLLHDTNLTDLQENTDQFYQAERSNNQLYQKEKQMMCEFIETLPSFTYILSDQLDVAGEAIKCFESVISNQSCNPPEEPQIGVENLATVITNEINQSLNHSSESFRKLEDLLFRKIRLEKLKAAGLQSDLDQLNSVIDLMSGEKFELMEIITGLLDLTFSGQQEFDAILRRLKKKQKSSKTEQREMLISLFCQKVEMLESEVSTSSKKTHELILKQDEQLKNCEKKIQSDAERIQVLETNLQEHLMICQRFDELVKSLVSKIVQEEEANKTMGQELSVSIANTQTLEDELVVNRMNQEKLHTELQSLKDSCDETLEEERFYYEQKIGDLESRIQAYKYLIAEKDAQFEELQLQLETTSSHQQSSRQIMTNKCGLLEAEICNLKDQLEVNKRQIALLESTVTSKDEKLTETQRQLYYEQEQQNSIRSRMESQQKLEKLNSGLQQESINIRQLLEEKNDELVDCQQQIQDLKEQLGELNTMIDTLNVQNNELGVEREEKEHHILDLMNEVQRLKIELKSQTEVLKLNEESSAVQINQLKEDLKTLEEKLAEKFSVESNLSNEVNSLSQILQTTNQEKNNLEKGNISLERELKNLNVQLAYLKEESQSRTAVVNQDHQKVQDNYLLQLEEANQELRRKNSDQENILKDQGDKILELESELHTQHQKIEDLCQKISFSDNKLYKTELEKQELKMQLSQIEQKSKNFAAEIELLRSEVRKNREPNLKTSGQSIEDSESQSHIQDLIEKVANLEEKVETRNATITQLTDKLISLTEKNESLSFELERLRDQEGTSDKQDSKNQEIERLTLYNEELKRKLELLKLDLKEAQVSAENIEQELVRTKSERDISLPSSMMKKKQTQGGLLRGIAGLFLTDNDVESIHQ